ncbi:Disease resistance protein [Corchorus capsularis]|uniref:Disease resistance protein n=1 Tax=Corchorus capsularis TaxID=210143 RepID=A0A1R3JI13_COCAP|nr:Disease resistance protein [Corchorus capsularis]
MESIATTLVATLANHLLNICRPEGGRNKIEEDVEAIRTDLRRLEAILRDYDAKEGHDQQLQIDIEQLRVASFKAADALEAYDNLHQLPRDCLCGIFKSMIKNLRSQKEIASAIRHAKSSVSIQLNAVDKQAGNTLRELPYNFDSIWKSLKEDALLLEEDDLVGIEKPRENLIRWLLEEDSKRKVISVVGMGGLGKTTLVKKVFDDIKVKNQFKFRVWTTISESFNMDELLKDIVRQIYNLESVPREVEVMKSTRLKETIKSSLQSGSYVLILDDVWSRDAWIAIETSLPKGNGGRVIFTTRNARTSPPLGEIHLMGKLSHEESKILFLKKTFPDGNCPTDLEQNVESIVRKCDGLPLAINAIGAFLSKKTDKNEWELADRSLGFELMENKEIDFMNKILSLSYNELPDELKSCFLYLSIFPEDYSIEYNRLIRLWMAEKFVEVEEVAEEYFKMLQARNLIQATEISSEGRVKACRVHDILHEICISKSRHQKFAAIYKDGYASAPENSFRRLSVHNTLQNLEQIRIKYNFNVRALFVFGLVDSPSKAFMHTLLHENYRMVRLLDLQAAPLEQFPREITNLVHLRYLSLRQTKSTRKRSLIFQTTSTLLNVFSVFSDYT